MNSTGPKERDPSLPRSTLLCLPSSHSPSQACSPPRSLFFFIRRTLVPAFLFSARKRLETRGTHIALYPPQFIDLSLEGATPMRTADSPRLRALLSSPLLLSRLVSSPFVSYVRGVYREPLIFPTLDNWVSARRWKRATTDSLKVGVSQHARSRTR